MKNELLRIYAATALDPDPYLFLVGAAISAFGRGVGKGIPVLKRRKEENEIII